jgi:hypothetical protein
MERGSNTMTIDTLGELPLWKDEAAQNILEELSTKYKVPLSVLKELVASEQSNVGREKRRGIYTDFDTALDSLEEVE